SVRHFIGEPIDGMKPDETDVAAGRNLRVPAALAITIGVFQRDGDLCARVVAQQAPKGPIRRNRVMCKRTIHPTCYPEALTAVGGAAQLRWMVTACQAARTSQRASD